MRTKLHLPPLNKHKHDNDEQANESKEVITTDGENDNNSDNKYSDPDLEIYGGFETDGMDLSNENEAEWSHEEVFVIAEANKTASKVLCKPASALEEQETPLNLAVGSAIHDRVKKTMESSKRNAVASASTSGTTKKTSYLALVAHTRSETAIKKIKGPNVESSFAK